MGDMSASAQPTPARTASTPGTLQCPTCRTAWRSAVTCPRCGTDLTSLMHIAVQAWALRQAARAALCNGQCAAKALALAQEAYRLHATLQGQHLLALALLAHGEPAAAATLLAQLQSVS